MNEQRRAVRTVLLVGLAALVGFSLGVLLEVGEAPSEGARSPGETGGRGPSDGPPAMTVTRPDPSGSPAVFSFEELTALARSPAAAPELELRVAGLLRTPFVRNRPGAETVSPRRPEVPGLGPVVRVVAWNTEGGGHLDRLRRLLAGTPEDVRDGDDGFSDELRLQLEVLRGADVLVLQGVDWGMPRSGYREVPKELAEQTGMHWAYGVEFVEVDPFRMGIDSLASSDPEGAVRVSVRSEVDRDRYAGLHGNAVLSRYRILEARLIPLTVQTYDWYTHERRRVERYRSLTDASPEESILVQMTRRMRRGGRTLMLVELEVPDLPEGRVTVASVRLENHSTPEERLEQMTEVLGYLEEIDHPVVLTGDFNTTGGEGVPTSWEHKLRQELGEEEFWLDTALDVAGGAGFLLDLFESGVDRFRGHTDPTVADLPLLAENPEEELFETIEAFRFADGGRFDFRGDPERSIGNREGTLANSNERDVKGFVATYRIEALGPDGEFKLDWIFVKAYAEAPRDPSEPYLFAPHFGRTLHLVGREADPPVSGHLPVSVDLPAGKGEPDGTAHPG